MIDDVTASTDAVRRRRARNNREYARRQGKERENMAGRKRTTRRTRVAKTYIPVSEAAQMQGVTSQAVRSWAHKGQVKSRKIGGRIMIDAASLEKRNGNGHATSNGDAPATREPATPARNEDDVFAVSVQRLRETGESLVSMGENLIAMSQTLEVSLEEHDDAIRAETGDTLVTLGTNLQRLRP